MQMIPGRVAGGTNTADRLALFHTVPALDLIYTPYPARDPDSGRRRRRKHRYPTTLGPPSNRIYRLGKRKRRYSRNAFLSTDPSEGKKERKQ